MFENDPNNIFHLHFLKKSLPTGRFLPFSKWLGFSDSHCSANTTKADFTYAEAIIAENLISPAYSGLDVVFHVGGCLSKVGLKILKGQEISNVLWSGGPGPAPPIEQKNSSASTLIKRRSLSVIEASDQQNVFSNPNLLDAADFEKLILALLEKNSAFLANNTANIISFPSLRKESGVFVPMESEICPTKETELSFFELQFASPLEAKLRIALLISKIYDPILFRVRFFIRLHSILDLSFY